MRRIEPEERADVERGMNRAYDLGLLAFDTLDELVFLLASLDPDATKAKIQEMVVDPSPVWCLGFCEPTGSLQAGAQLITPWRHRGQDCTALLWVLEPGALARVMELMRRRIKRVEDEE